MLCNNKCHHSKLLNNIILFCSVNIDLFHVKKSTQTLQLVSGDGESLANTQSSPRGWIWGRGLVG